jgi:hypothetical protein
MGLKTITVPKNAKPDLFPPLENLHLHQWVAVAQETKAVLAKSLNVSQ